MFMKKSMLFLMCTGYLVFSSFTKNPKYPEDVPQASVALFNSEYIETINNDVLNSTLENYFVIFFDEVISVDVQFSKIGSYYYYIAFGKKDKNDVIQLLKIHKKDYLNQTYTFIDFSKVNDFNAIELCYVGDRCPVCTHERCCYSCSTVCGLWDGFNCSF